MMHKVLSYLSTKMRHNHIWRSSEQAYMYRYFTKPTQEQAKWFLHHIALPDGDGHHSHPYSWQFSLILSGSYDEEVLDTTTGEIKTYRRRWFNWIPNNKYHRIKKLHGKVWSIFLFGAKHGSSWGFWEPGVGHIHNTEYKRLTGDAGVFWDGDWYYGYRRVDSNLVIRSKPYATRAEAVHRLYQSAMLWSPIVA